MKRCAYRSTAWWVLLGGFSAILGAMLWVTVRASLHESVFAAGPKIWADPWAQATLLDAYFGFLVVYVWIFFRETSAGTRSLWFILLMTLGNIAIAIYFLRALLTAPRRDWRTLFPRLGDSTP